MNCFTWCDHKFYFRNQQQRRWRGPRRHRRPEYLLGEVVPEWTRGSWRNHVGTVQGQSPSERLFGTRSRRSYSSGSYLFNDFSVRSLNKCVSRKVLPTLSINLPLFWHCRKRLRTSWYACSLKWTTSRSVVNLLRYKTNIFSYGNVYLDVINKSHFFMISLLIDVLVYAGNAL